MTAYVMNINRTDGRVHEVHHETCNHGPSIFHQVNLGYHYSDRDAMIAAKTLYRDADGCYYCMPRENHG